MKKLFAILTAVALTLSMAACASGASSSAGASGSSAAPAASAKTSAASKASGSVYKLNFSTTMAQGNTNVDAFDKAMDEIEKRTNGAVQFARTYSGTMGGEHDLGVMCMAGDLDIVCVGPGNLSDWDKAFQVFDTPFLFQNFDHYDAVLANDGYNQWLDEKGAQLGIKFLMTGNQGFKGIINSKHPVVSASDLKDLKIRVPDSTSLIEIGKAMGYIPTPVAATDQYMSLSQGIIDGADHSMVAHLNWKLPEIAKYFTETNHALQSTFLLMNRKKLESMPQEYQDTILKVCGEVQNEMNAKTRKEGEASLATAEGQGVKIVYNKDVDIASFKTALSNIIATYSQADPKLYDIISHCA